MKAITFHGVNSSVKKVLQPFFFSHKEKLEPGLFSHPTIMHLCIRSQNLPLYTTLFSLHLTTYDRMYIHLQASCKMAFMYSLLNTEFLGFFISNFVKVRKKYQRRVKNHAQIIHNPDKTPLVLTQAVHFKFANAQ
jgi:hypothetical protein